MVRISTINTLETLHNKNITCKACSLRKGCIQVVPGIGDERSTIMIVGEAPGQDEDQQGEPFVGRSGKFLDACLREVGLDRNGVYITNTVCCRPPKNRTPEQTEIDTCKIWLWKKIQTIKPKVIVTLGVTPLALLLKADRKKIKISNLVTQAEFVSYLDSTLIVCYHPSYYLRKPNEKTRKVFIDALSKAKDLTSENIQKE